MRKGLVLAVLLLLLFGLGVAYAADIVPTDIQQPGTQPKEISKLDSVDKCDNCHGGYDEAVEPGHNWRGSMMAQAGRDPIFWGTMAIAEQDFDGSGDLCIRCHSPKGWLRGVSTPTDGSRLRDQDADGVECDFCHKMTNPDNSEHQGEQFPPFIANNEGDPGWKMSDPIIGYYGSGMYVMWGKSDMLGPYDGPILAEARHQYMQSEFHRSIDFCGTCHDVSNPAVGDLAHNNGTQLPDPVNNSGTLGSPVDGKAAFNNFPYQYGIVERTYSEYMAGLLSQTGVSDYSDLPDDLQGGAIKAAYDKAMVADTGGNYSDGTPRNFSCQSCHMSPVTGAGCDKPGAPIRTDLPLHDMTGGNYWMPDAIMYLDAQDKLRLGGGLTDEQIAALEDGKERAKWQLENAANLSVDGDTLKVVNLAGHKLISGYPEGRRMWVNIKWYDDQGALLREDGKYGNLSVTIDGDEINVSTILDLQGTNTKIYEVHPAITQEWANQLLGLGYNESLPLSYDRVTGEVEITLGELANPNSGSYSKTFHFVLNNKVAEDNRIPPYNMSYDEAEIRNCLPVPADQYGDPGSGGVYNYWDEIALNPPEGADNATITLLYQPTSWEYVQFLYLANDGSNPFLANEGAYMLDAWLNTGMAEPYEIASVQWYNNSATAS